MAKVITVLSGKGGVGKSTFCANIGRVLSENKKVLLIDGDVSLRSLDMLLGLDSMVVFDWSDVIFGRCMREKACLFASEKLHLLSAPLSLSESLHKEDFDRLIVYYKDLYDYIFIDSPAGINELTEIYAHSADEIIIVATPDSVSLRAAYITGDKLYGGGIPENKMRLVLNKVNFKLMRRGIQKNLDDAVDKTYLRLLGVVPRDSAIEFSANGGEILLSQRTSNAFYGISARILGKDVKLYV